MYLGRWIWVLHQSANSTRPQTVAAAQSLPDSAQWVWS
jgi:hypothetical protein